MSTRNLTLAVLLVSSGSCDLLRRPDQGLEPPACAACRITVTPVLQLDFTGAPSLPDMATTIALDANRLTFAVVAGPARTEFMLFDEDGRFVQTIGTGGEGPGEYSRIDDLVFDATDSLWVFDGGNARADVYGPGEFMPARSVPIDGRMAGLIALGDGTFLVPGGGATVEGMAFQARRLHRDGGSEPFAPAASDRALGQEVVIAAGIRDRIWLTPLHAYALEEWTTRGARQQSIERAPPWFAVVDPERIAAYQELLDARPAIGDLAVDAAGRIWVIGGVLDASAPDPASAGRTDVNIDGWFDTVIEIVDAASATLITSARFDFAPPRWLRDGLAARFVIDIVGTPGIEITRLDFHEF